MPVERPGASFYVTVKDGGRTGWLLGPFDTHAEALAAVDRGRTLALAADPRAHFYAFGTASIGAGSPQPTVRFK